MKNLPVSIRVPAKGEPPRTRRYRSLMDTEPDTPYWEAHTADTIIRDAPDALDPAEGAAVLESALRLTNIGFAAERGVPWPEIVRKLDEYGYDPVAPSIRAMPRRSIFGLVPRGRE